MAAAAEAALRTRGKLLADRTPGRDVRELPLPPLTPERSWAREGGPVLPRPTGPAGAGGAGSRARAQPGSGRRRPRSSSLGATWRLGSGGDALGLAWGGCPDPQVGVGPAPRGPQRFAAHPRPDFPWREDRDPTPSVSSQAQAGGEFRSRTDQRRSFHSSRPPPPPLPSHSPAGIRCSCTLRSLACGCDAALAFSSSRPSWDFGCGTSTTLLRRCLQTFPFFFWPGLKPLFDPTGII